MQAGMDVARMNFSHGTHDAHRRVHERIRGLAEETGRNVAILMDLQGPKIRTGALEGGNAVILDDGAPFCVTTHSVAGNAERVSTTYELLPNDVKPGDRLLVADGSIELLVEAVSGPDVHCRVARGGKLGQHKGINLPGVAVSSPSLTDKDLEDLEFGLALGMDYVALSFVRSPEDVTGLKRHIADAGYDVPVIAKIERPEALSHIDEIVGAADGIMVARGDLGVEVPLDDVPQIQKTLIRLCNARGKPVVTATQMLESMMVSPRPTRAEVADVANAIYDGTDAVMLSGETAAGEFPVEAARTMAGIAEKADEAIASRPAGDPGLEGDALTPGDSPFSFAIGRAVSSICSTLNAKRIVCFTMSGYTAMMIARFRPRTPITAITLSEEARRRCALVWGVDAVTSAEVTSTDQMVPLIDTTLTERGLASAGDCIIAVAGTPLAVGGRTNILKLHRIGDIG
jgi:pyruvate kinase